MEIVHQGAIELEVEKLKFVPASPDVVPEMLPNTESHYTRGFKMQGFEPLALDKAVSFGPLQGWFNFGSPVGPNVLKAADSADPLAKYRTENLPVLVSLVDQCLKNKAGSNVDLMKAVQPAFFAFRISKGSDPLRVFTRFRMMP